MTTTKSILVTIQRWQPNPFQLPSNGGEWIQLPYGENLFFCFSSLFITIWVFHPPCFACFLASFVPTPLLFFFFFSFTPLPHPLFFFQPPICFFFGFLTLIFVLFSFFFRFWHLFFSLFILFPYPFFLFSFSCLFFSSLCLVLLIFSPYSYCFFFLIFPLLFFPFFPLPLFLLPIHAFLSMHFWAIENIRSLGKGGMSHVFGKPLTRAFQKKCHKPTFYGN